MGAFTIAITLFFTLNSLGNVPVFIALLKELPHRRQIYVIIREMIIALGLMLLFAYAGQLFLDILGLNQFSISIGGGIILLFISIQLVFPPRNAHPVPHLEPTHREPLIVPLATPIMAGGGTLATVMMYGLQSHHSIGLFVGIIAAWTLSTLVLLSSPFLVRLMSRELLTAIERMSGLILILIAAQMLVGGMTSFVGSEIEQWEKISISLHQKLLPETEPAKNSG